MDKILSEDLRATREFMNEKIKNREHKLFTGDASEIKVVQVLNIVEEVELLQEENKNLKFANQVLDKRLRHLFQSKTIQKYDEINYFTKKHKLNIKDLDKWINRLIKYYQFDMQLALLTGCSLEKLIDLITIIEIEILDYSSKGVYNE